jgi:class 3 adenylate cyclase/DNA-binding CsgD family transcriptional regulator
MRRHTSVVAPLPTGVVTFVLTDVVGSTELWDRAPEAMTAALARHDEIVTEAVTAEGGALIKSKGEGDSTFSAFVRASDALRAAYRLQQAMRSERWPTGATIRTRVAVHSGEAVERDGDYLGTAVNRVARLRGAAHGGEIIVSAATAAIVRTTLPPGCSFVDLGPIELRGLDEPEPALALTGPDLDPVSRLRPTSRLSALGGLPTGRVPTRREDAVLALLREDLTNIEIAARLNISERTVESHVSSLQRKLGAGDRRQLVRPGAAATPSGSANAVATVPALPAMLELMADASTFVGRHSERQVLRERWQLARAGHTLVVLVTGEAGMGKSRLVSELAVDVHADGGRVLFGACYEDVEQPYGPFAQAISADAAELEAADLGRRAGSDFDALARFAPGLTRAMSSSERQGGDGDVDVSERGEVLDAIERWLITTASDVPLLLVLEDLHWSTPSTRDALLHLARRAGRHPLLAAVTARDTAPDLDPHLSRLLADLERSPAVTRVQLHGLDRDEVAAVLGTASVDHEAIVADTGGNPLLVTHMAADGSSGSLAAILLRRDQLLDDDARALLDLAATFGSEFDADLLATGHGAPLESVLESLERAEAAGLIVPLPGRFMHFGFVHALFRSHRYQALPPRRRLEAHANAARALSARSGDDRLLSERARHACLAVPVGDARIAVDLSREAAHIAEHAYAYDEAASHYRRALEAASSLHPPDANATLDLSVRLAAALHHHGDPQGLPMLLDGARRAREAGDHEALVRAAISFSHFGSAGATPAQLAVVEDAVAVLGVEPTATRARLLIELAGQVGRVRADESVELAREAESIARHLGDPELLGSVLLGARHISRHPSRMAEYERIGVELEALGQQLSSLALTLAGISVQTLTHLERGDCDRWMAGQQRFVRLLGDRSLPQFQLIAHVNRASRAVLDGDFEEAERLAMAMGRMASSIGHSPVAAAGAILLITRRLQARDVELLDALETIVHRRSSETSIYRCSLAAVQARAGHHADARHALSTLHADGYPIHKGYAWTLAMAELAEAAEVAGDPQAAAHVLREVGPYSGNVAVAGSGINRPLDQALAQAALATGEVTLAEQYALVAVSASRRRSTPVFLCRELVLLADAPIADVRPLIQEATTIAERLGVQIVRVDLDRYRLRT